MRQRAICVFSTVITKELRTECAQYSKYFSSFRRICTGARKYEHYDSPHIGAIQHLGELHSRVAVSNAALAAQHQDLDEARAAVPLGGLRRRCACSSGARTHFLKIIEICKKTCKNASILS